MLPLYKQKGNSSSPSYRPISLLSAISKVFGRIVKSQLLKFCPDRYLIPDEQFGFLSGCSTEWQLLSLTECFQEAMEIGHNRPVAQFWPGFEDGANTQLRPVRSSASCRDHPSRPCSVCFPIFLPHLGK